MNEFASQIQDLLKKESIQNGFDVVQVIRVHGIQGIDEILSRFDQSQEFDTVSYILQVKPKAAPSAPLSETPAESLAEVEDEMTLPDGKLNAPFLLKNGNILLDAGDFTLAKNIFKAILQTGELTSVAHSKLAQCLDREGKIEEALNHLEQSIAYQPTLETYEHFSRILIQQSKDSEAAEALERALLLKDLSSKDRFELCKASGNCWTRAQKHDRAEAQYKKALEINPSADEIQSNLGVLYLQSSNILQAKRHFQNALASHPKNYLALAGLGSCHLASGERAIAYDYFAESLNIELNNPTAIYYLVKCAHDTKNYAIAAKLLQKYIQIAPINPNLLYSLAGLQFHLGRLEDAKNTVSNVLQLQADHLGAKELLTVLEKY